MIELNSQYDSWYLHTLNKTDEVQALKNSSRQRTDGLVADRVNTEPAVNRDRVDFSDDALQMLQDRAAALEESGQENVEENLPSEKEPYHIIEFIKGSLPKPVEIDTGNANSEVVMSSSGETVNRPRQLSFDELIAAARENNSRVEERSASNSNAVSQNNLGNSLVNRPVENNENEIDATSDTSAEIAEKSTENKLTPAQEDAIEIYEHIQNYSNALNLSNANSAA